MFAACPLALLCSGVSGLVLCLVLCVLVCVQCGSIADAGECASNVLCDACVDFSGSLLGCVDVDVSCAAAFSGASSSSSSIGPVIGGAVGGLVVIGAIIGAVFLVVSLASQCVVSRLVPCVCPALLAGHCLPDRGCLRA